MNLLFLVGFAVVIGIILVAFRRVVLRWKLADMLDLYVEHLRKGFVELGLTDTVYIQLKERDVPAILGEIAALVGKVSRLGTGSQAYEEFGLACRVIVRVTAEVILGSVETGDSQISRARKRKLRSALLNFARYDWLPHELPWGHFDSIEWEVWKREVMAVLTEPEQAKAHSERRRITEVSNAGDWDNPAGIGTSCHRRPMYSAAEETIQRDRRLMFSDFADPVAPNYTGDVEDEVISADRPEPQQGCERCLLCGLPKGSCSG